MRSCSILVGSLSLFLLAACGAGGGGGGGGVATYAAKCMTACTPAGGSPCANQAATDCQNDCTTETTGLALQCAQCLLDHTGWSTTTCICDMTGCKTCGKSPGFTNQPCTTGENFMCEPGTICTGYRIGKLSDCDTACAPKADGSSQNN